LDTLPSRVPEAMAAPGRPILVCRSGARASMAAGILMAAGMPGAVVMKGGILAWEKDGLPVVKEKVPWSVERQVRTIAATLVLVGSLLGLLVSRWFLAVPIFVGAGLLMAGLTNSCLMAMVLMKLPYNQKALQPKAPPSGTCAMDGGSGGGGTCAMDSDSDAGGGCSM
jgi:hypothetical protein